MQPRDGTADKAGGLVWVGRYEAYTFGVAPLMTWEQGWKVLEGWAGHRGEWYLGGWLHFELSDCLVIFAGDCCWSVFVVLVAVCPLVGSFLHYVRYLEFDGCSEWL